MKPQTRWCCNWDHSDKQESRTRCSHVWVGREAACPKSDLADVLLSGVVPNRPYLNDWPFPGFSPLFERNISHGRAGVVRTNQNPSQHPAKAAFLSSNLKHAGLVLGSSHPGPSSCLLDFWFPSRCRQRLSPKI